MGKVIASAAMSVDGFIAGTDDAVGPLFELSVNVAPVVFGSGVRFFGEYAGFPVSLDNPQVIDGDRVTHLHYRVTK